MVDQQRPARPRPRTTADHDLDDLGTALSEAEQLLPVLARLLPEPTSAGPTTGVIGRHAPESSEPWHAEAAAVYWDIWFGARYVANQMRQIVGVPPQAWGSGDTSRALGSIGRYAPAVPDATLRVVLGTVQGWVARARQIRDIDEVDAWRPVPRAPGQEPPACPYCRTLSLRMSPHRQEVRCFFPGCRDLDGNPTRARMEPALLDAAGQLVFGDGTVVAYREGHES